MNTTRKLRVGASLAAFVLFFLPWVDIQCSQQRMATQTGVQVIYGGGSPVAGVQKSEKAMSPKMNSQNFGKQPSSRKFTSQNDSAGFSVLLAVAFLLTIISVAASFIGFIRPWTNAEPISAMLPGLTLALILIQLAIGFPVESKLEEEFSRVTAASKTSKTKAKEDIDNSMAAAVMTQIQVSLTPAFYLELLALGIPTLISLNAFMDKLLKKNTPPAGWEGY